MMRGYGFTLIEMLVTITIFSLMLSSLVVCLRLGADTYDRVQRRLDSELTLNHALGQIKDDLRNAYLEPDNEEIVFMTSGNSSLTLDFFRTMPEPPANSNWQEQLLHVQYKVQSAPDERHRQLIRSAAPVILEETEQAEHDKMLLPLVKDLDIEFYDNGTWIAAWETPQGLPRAVRIRGSYNDGKRLQPFSLTVHIKANEYFSAHAS